MNIEEIYCYLSWENSVETQKNGIVLAKQIQDLSYFILPRGKKHIWENCAKILQGKSDSELQTYLYDLFGWFQDMNWPGAYIIYDRLMRSENKAVLLVAKKCLEKANEKKDIPWSSALSDFIKQYEMIN